ncbi:DUF3558 domain-containing protein [Lentzea flava]|uniref:DUF3558 domain-containing protein n=1 Tax=Lentzea flava TaxID=103732 RepID=A0ABQ2UNY4_9PSEU|nr:DUF3558 domain-containing protein [Lentzea flava]MCP2200922.1 Protein of unknown function (DUF3558) [Lentzea flava]GGU47049.1 hypothetical protein GCM10010178_44440 [Lentzea flava]
MNSRIVLTSLATATLVAITACTGSTAGDPKPTPDTSSPTSSEDSRSSTSSPTSTKASGSLADTDPCGLLTKSEAEQVLGPLKEEPKPQKIGSSRGCEFAPNRVFLSVGIRTDVGLAGVQATGGEIKDIKVGGHQAKQLLGAGGSCIVAVGVTSSSRVDITLNAGSSTDPCPPALKIAELVEPKLP